MKTAVVYDKWFHQNGGAEVVACRLASLLQKDTYQVTLVTGREVNRKEVALKLGNNLEGIESKIMTDSKGIEEFVSGKDLFINVSFMDYVYGRAKKNIYYVHFPTPIKSLSFNLLLAFFRLTNAHKLFPFRERIDDRLRAGIFFNFGKRLQSYQVIVANSRFTSEVIRYLWQRQARIIYPPVSLLTDKTKIKKKKQIASVGRFFTLGHGKKQEVMVRAFKKLYDQGYKDWQLHLAGGLGNEPSSLRFMEELKSIAAGYPVFFHINASKHEVEDLLAQSEIYWHTAGFGEDEEKTPIKLEHFGIAPVEAISAGCIPVLYNGGGLKEIVDTLGLDKNLHLFSTIDELVKKTKLFMDGKEKMDFGPVAKKLSGIFSERAFERKFLELL